MPNIRASQAPETLTHHARGALSVDVDRPLRVLSARAVVGEMTHTFTGAEGHLIYAQMSGATQRALAAWVEKQWTPWWGPAEVRDPRVSYSEGVTTLRYHLLVWARPNRELKPSPQLWGSRFAQLKERERPLILPFTHQVVDLTLTGVEVLSDEREVKISLPTQAARAQDLPNNTQRSRARGFVQELKPTLWHETSLADHPKTLQASFKREVKREVAQGEARPIQTHLKLTWSITGGVIGAERYRAWRRFARSVDRLERLKVRAAPLSD